MEKLILTEVEKKFGKKISYQKDCKLLSNSILNTIHEYISPATLRRLFGFLATNSNPSRVTLDILSRYVGYSNWEHFISIKKEATIKNINSDELWNTMRSSAEKISHLTFEKVKAKSGIAFDQITYRKFADERINNLLADKCSTTALVAPGGYGKSTTLACWYLKHYSEADKIILFASASILEQFANSDSYIDMWLAKLLGLSQNLTVISEISNQTIDIPGTLIIIFDALDEITLRGPKLDKVLSALVSIADKFANTNKVKLIISTRLTSWKILESLIIHKEHWYFVQPLYFTPDESNFPALNYEEIQEVFDKTINKKLKQNLLVFELHPDVRTVLGYPFYLQLFVTLYSPKKPNLLNNKLDLLSEFAKQKIYISKLSDEKLDIINFLAEQAFNGNHHTPKAELKDAFPIHLKQAGNYFEAYNQLISYGILTEDLFSNNLGGVSKTVRFTNQQLFALFIVQWVFNKNATISAPLISKLDNNFAETEMYPYVLSFLIWLLCKNRNTDILKNIFRTCPNLLTSKTTIEEFFIALQSDTFLLDKLIPTYFSNQFIRNYLISNFFYINRLTSTYSTLLGYLVKSSTQKNDLVPAHTFLSLSGYLELKTDKAQNNYRKVENEKPNFSTHPIVAGAWFAASILENFFNTKPSGIQASIKQAKDHFSIIDTFAEKIEFAELLIPTLALTGKGTQIPIFLPEHQPATSSHYTAVYFIANLLEKTINEVEILDSECEAILQLYPQFNQTRNYPWIIIGETLRSKHYLDNGKLAEANQCIRNAIELCNVADYRLGESVLLSELAKRLKNLGEDSNAEQCNNMAQVLWSNSGFKPYSSLKD